MILIADDEVDLVGSYARVLRQAGFRCATAFSVSDALSAFDLQHPALVISDISFPESDGFEICRHVRQKAPDTPVILMTANRGPDVEQKANRAGAARYLQKPFSNRELVAAVESLIGSAQP